MLKRLNKIAQRSIQLNNLAITKKAGLGAPLAGIAAKTSKKVGVGAPMVGAVAAGMSAPMAIHKAKKVEKENFNPARRDLMLGIAPPG